VHCRAASDGILGILQSSDAAGPSSFISAPSVRESLCGKKTSSKREESLKNRQTILALKDVGDFREWDGCFDFVGIYRDSDGMQGQTCLPGLFIMRRG
jgi:hypothetical protein